MPTTFRKAPPDIYELVDDLIDQNYQTIKAAKVRIDLWMATPPCDDDGEPTDHALKLHGVPANAIVKVVSYENRCKGAGDAEIKIAEDLWESWNEARRASVLDHELHHIIVKQSNTGVILTDDLNRPRISLRPHDFDHGFFTAIAKRHGENSTEVIAMRHLMATAGNIYVQGELSLDRTEQVAQAVRRQSVNTRGEK